jgi:hypothetical protein
MIVSADAPAVLQGDDPSLYINFNDCASYGGGSNADYSEFTAISVVNTDCTQLDLMGGFVYRDNAADNKHSCAPGRNNTSAMCISAMNECVYDPASDLDLKFDIRVIPGVDGIGMIDEVSFYSRAPEQFQFLEGPTGDNNYPTLYTFRVMVNGLEIYRAEDMPLNGNWRLQTYDFSSEPGFTVTDTTIFNFEILPYCLAGVPSTIQAWDIEDLTIRGGCGIVDGGVISTVAATTVCNKAGEEAIIDFDLSGAKGDSSVWIVASGNGRILEMYDAGTIDFSGFSIGLFSVYHLSYQNEIIGLEEGAFLSGLVGCYDISNPIGINNLRVSGGELLTDGLQNAVSFCSGDGLPDIITTVLNDHIGSNTSYIVTDADSIVLNIDDDPDFDFEGAAAGTCLFFALAHEKNNPGIMAGDHLNTLENCFELSTAITVSRTKVDGGEIDTNGATSLTVCAGEVLSIEVNVTGSEGLQEAWIVSDLAGEILQLPSGPPFDLAGVTATECRIWHISYNGINNLGLGQNLSALSGCFDLSNPIDIEKMTVNGGTLMLAGGGDAITICADDGVSDAFNIMLMNAIGDSSQWLVSDTAGMILALPSNPPFEFEGAGAGICELYRISHNGGLSGLAVGQLIEDIVGCFALSNAITVTRLTGADCPVNCDVDGGIIDLFNNGLCVGDGEADIMDADVFNAVGNFSYFILTDSDSLIIMVLDSLPVDLDDLSEGTFFFWHLSSDTPLVVDSSLMHINDIDLACFDISDPASFSTTFNNAGNVSLLDGSVSIAICLSDTISDILSFMSSSIADNNYQFVVTDTLNVILGLPDSTQVDFGGAGPGTCLVWGVSYTGNFLPVVGDTLGNEMPNGFCFDISDNAVEVVRDTLGGACAVELCLVEGGIIDLFDNAVCVGDGVPDLIDGSVSGAVGGYQTYVITDSDSLVLAVPSSLPVDLDASGAGVCLFWHLSANDSLSITQGMHINNITECHDLSDAAAVVRTENNAGLVSLISGVDSITICLSDTLSDVLEFMNSSMSGNSYQYVVTDTANVILNLPDSTLVDFSAAAEGTCYVYGVSYTGSFIPVVGDTLGNELPGNDCYNISANFVEVVRVSGMGCPNDCDVDAGVLTLDMNTACVGDGVADLIDGTVSGEQGDYFVFLITGTDSLILGITPNLPINFESAGPGACLIWHLASNDSIPINMGINVNTITGCFDLAEPQQVTRTDNNAGIVNLDGGATSITICVGDGAADNLVFENSSSSGNNYQYVITDSTNHILALPAVDSFDFENAGVGTCLVWGVSYTGTFDLVIGDSLDVVPSAGGCFDISGNFIEVIRVDSGPMCVKSPIAPDEGIAFRIYPNPAIENIAIEIISIPEDYAEILVFDSFGNMISKKIYDDIGHEPIKINLPDLVAGTYFIRMKSKTRVSTQKFLIAQ